MPLVIEGKEHAPTCILSTWAVKDATNFVDVLAWLYLRKPAHAAKIMKQLDPGPAGLPGKAIENAIKLLRYDVDDIANDLVSADPKIVEKATKIRETRISHRDGLLFQHVSWVAATIQFPRSAACPPHVRKADKGFDGLVIEIDRKTNGLSRLVLCEDKASVNPRPLVTGSIWPSIQLINTGEKDLEILDAVTALLEKMPDVDCEAVLIGTTWERIRQYRVALAAGKDQLKVNGYQHLFDGFEDRVSGDLGCRMAEVMPMVDVRAYLHDLSGRIIANLQAMATYV